MKATNIFTLVLILILLSGIVYIFTNRSANESASDSVVKNETTGINENEAESNNTEFPTTATEGPVVITAISHATVVLDWNGITMYTDPVGGGVMFAQAAAPDVILLTDTHGDHLDVETLEAVATADTTLVVPQVVFDELPASLQTQATVVVNEVSVDVGAFTITAVAMYNLPEGAEDNRHVKGRGNGYVIDDGSFRVYLAGDTEATEEFRSQENIDVAFVPMNLPYTMDVAQAADGVAEMNPAVVYPYHFRTPEGFSDVFTFESLLADANDAVQVVILDWYQDTKADTNNQ